MNLLKRSICLLMVGVLAVGLAACGGTEEQPSSSTDTTSWRPNPEKVEVVADADTDGDFDYKTVDWNGPEGYVIVVPAGDINAKTSAEYLQKYYSEVHKVTLKIVTDATKETEKEILVGKTNRSQSAKDMAEADLEVSVKDGKLVFDGGHYVTVDSAVKKFARKLPEKGKAHTFKLTTDFSSTLSKLEGYTYVWGDEFEAADIDYTKWDFEQRMFGNNQLELTYGNESIDVSDGRLKLFARHYFHPIKDELEYTAPYSTLHKYHMNYRYGYCEIRAKVPFEAGVWPSFWGLSACNLSGVDGDNHGNFSVEVDIFEIFGDEETVVPNIHKWYNDCYDYNAIHGLDGTRNHTQWDSEKKDLWLWSEHGADLDKLDDEYHLYGYEWTPNECSMWVDGEKYMTFDLKKSYDKNNEMTQFHDPMYFMFNMHVFTVYESMQPNLIEENMGALPAEYAIDWYRVYQKKDSKSKIWIVDEPRTDITYTGRDNPWKAE